MQTYRQLVPKFVTTFVLAFGAVTGAPTFAADVKTTAEIKSEILATARANQFRTDNTLEVFFQLNQLIADLVKLEPVKPESTKKDLVVGGWAAVWSNLPYSPNADRSQVYQVVSPDGYYYNLSRQAYFGGATATNILRGQYSDAGDYLAIEFTRAALAPGWFDPGTKLLDIGRKIESKEINGYDIPGPIGFKGILANVYVDKDLRIVTGGDNIFQSALIFVLVRSESIATP